MKGAIICPQWQLGTSSCPARSACLPTAMRLATAISAWLSPWKQRSAA